MNDLEKLEKELAGLQPDDPTVEFSKKVENALGQAGTVAMCHLNSTIEENNDKISGSVLHFPMIPPLVGLVAMLLLGFYFSAPLILKVFQGNYDEKNGLITQPSSMVEDIDSPLNGVSLEQLEVNSGLPVNGWQDPSTEERFILRVDEGVVDRVTGTPARQYRYHYVDETMWTHPESDTRILTTSPRQEVYLIDLESF